MRSRARSDDVYEGRRRAIRRRPFQLCRASSPKSTQSPPPRLLETPLASTGGAWKTDAIRRGSSPAREADCEWSPLSPKLRRDVVKGRPETLGMTPAADQAGPGLAGPFLLAPWLVNIRNGEAAAGILLLQTGPQVLLHHASVRQYLDPHTACVFISPSTVCPLQYGTVCDLVCARCRSTVRTGTSI